MGRNLIYEIVHYSARGESGRAKIYFGIGLGNWPTMKLGLPFGGAFGIRRWRTGKIVRRL